MAFVGETVPKAQTGSAMGLLGTMSALGTTLGPTLGGPANQHPRLASDLLSLGAGYPDFAARTSLPAR